MDNLFRIVSHQAYKWPYLGLFTLGTAGYMLMLSRANSPVDAILSMVSAAVDWLAVFGFAKGKRFFDRGFWRFWFPWSLFWFFFSGPGRDVIVKSDLHGAGLILVAVTVLYYASFYLILYAYAYRDEGI